MTRITLIAVVEGQTENGVLTRLLASHLGGHGIDLHCPVVLKPGGARGGVAGLRCEGLGDQLRRHLKDRRQPVVTTFFDYYGLPTASGSGWAFVQQAKAEAETRGKVAAVKAIEGELHRLVTNGLDVPNAQTRFIPYIQLHELEALFFAEPAVTAAAFSSPSLAGSLAKAVTDCGGCEAINDRPQLAPSKRIESLYPGYVKGRSAFAHGPRIADKLNLARVRQACPRFSEWVGKLEALAAPV